MQLYHKYFTHTCNVRGESYTYAKFDLKIGLIRAAAKKYTFYIDLKT